MGIIGTDVITLVSAELLETHPYIGLDIFDHMAKMDRTIGVGKCAAN
jgi:hypothetical protein